MTRISFENKVLKYKLIIYTAKLLLIEIYRLDLQQGGTNDF